MRSEKPAPRMSRARKRRAGCCCQPSTRKNPFVERMIGSIRRECLDHVIVLDERHLGRILRKYVDYYHSCRTCRSRCRVGSCETSALLFPYWSVSWTTEGMTSR